MAVLDQTVLLSNCRPLKESHLESPVTPGDQTERRLAKYPDASIVSTPSTAENRARRWQGVRVLLMAQPSMVEGRRGARRPEQVPSEVRRLLEAGTSVTANLMEQICIDQGNLLASVIPSACDRANELRLPRLTDRMRAGGQVILDTYGLRELAATTCCRSDTVRAWGAMAVGVAPDISLVERLNLVRPFASDRHFAVREWAWIAVRHHVAEELMCAIELLAVWARDSDPLVRRFASEVTRPRGVWCAHISVLKSRPELALPILHPLCSDPAIYVQLSVGNWLNDASKTRPDWVKELCQRWLQRGDEATAKIVRRAFRTINKTKAAGRLAEEVHSSG